MKLATLDFNGGFSQTQFLNVIKIKIVYAKFWTNLKIVMFWGQSEKGAHFMFSGLKAVLRAAAIAKKFAN